MGFEGKPEDLKKNIVYAAYGDSEAKKRLSVAGKKGAKVRARNIAIKKAIAEHEHDSEWEELYNTRLRELKEVYPELDEEGNSLPDGWHEEEAAKTADAILKMKHIQKEMEKRGKNKK